MLREAALIRIPEIDVSECCRNIEPAVAFHM